MSAAEIKKTKLDLINWIDQLSDPDVLSFLSGLKESNAQNDWFDQLTAAQQQHLDQGLKDAESGRYVSSAEFWKRLKDE